MAEAPPPAYCEAWAAGSRSERISPRDGERRLTSAMRLTTGLRNAALNDCGTAASAAARSTARRRLRSPGRLDSVSAMILARVARILPFGWYSGKFDSVRNLFGTMLGGGTM